MNAFRRLGLLAGLLFATAALAACTVRPLYSSAPATKSGTASMAAELSSIAIKPATTRQGQEVRNQLIFLLYGGAAAPAAPAYSLELLVSSRVEVAASIQITSDDDEPTASTMTMTAAYTIRKTKGGAVVATGRRQITSSYDVPREEFAALRAQRDAENRSARELAELLRLTIAQDISRK